MNLFQSNTAAVNLSSYSIQPDRNMFFINHPSYNNLDFDPTILLCNRSILENENSREYLLFFSSLTKNIIVPVCNRENPRNWIPFSNPLEDFLLDLSCFISKMLSACSYDLSKFKEDEEQLKKFRKGIDVKRMFLDNAKLILNDMAQGNVTSQKRLLINYRTVFSRPSMEIYCKTTKRCNTNKCGRYYTIFDNDFFRNFVTLKDKDRVCISHSPSVIVNDIELTGKKCRDYFLLSLLNDIELPVIAGAEKSHFTDTGCLIELNKSLNLSIQLLKTIINSNWFLTDDFSVEEVKAIIEEIDKISTYLSFSKISISLK